MDQKEKVSPAEALSREAKIGKPQSMQERLKQVGTIAQKDEEEAAIPANDALFDEENSISICAGKYKIPRISCRTLYLLSKIGSPLVADKTQRGAIVQLGSKVIVPGTNDPTAQQTIGTVIDIKDADTPDCKAKIVTEDQIQIEDIPFLDLILAQETPLSVDEMLAALYVIMHQDDPRIINGLTDPAALERGIYNLTGSIDIADLPIIGNAIGEQMNSINQAAEQEKLKEPGKSGGASGTSTS